MLQDGILVNQDFTTAWAWLIEIAKYVAIAGRFKFRLFLMFKSIFPAFSFRSLIHTATTANTAVIMHPFPLSVSVSVFPFVTFTDEKTDR